MIQVTAAGMTIVVSSGDNGAQGNAGTCGYSPSYPATSQYAVAVGATSGPNRGTTEVGCQTSSK